MDTQQRKMMRNLIRRLVEAAKDHAFLGSKPPEEWDVIEDNLDIAQENLESFCKSLAGVTA